MSAIHDMLVQAVKLHQAGELTQAERLYRQVLGMDPQQADALNLLGVIANQVGEPEMALQYLRQALKIKPQEAEFHSNCAASCKAIGNVSAAIAHYREAIRFKPDAVGAHIYLSDALMEQGNLDEALSHSLQALRLQPNSALAHCTLGELAAQGCYTFTAENLQHMQSLLGEDGHQAAHDASLLCFTLAAHWEKQEAYEEAFRLYRQGNDLKGDVYRHSNQAFDRHKHRELIDRLIEVFTPELFRRIRPCGADSDRPIFVVGMVRSGTTLVEQILASHPQVFGAGELRDIDQISKALPNRLNSGAGYPDCLANVGPVALRELADIYLWRLEGLSGGQAIRVIDKMPHNCLHLGLIALLFPRARIIHVRRDPLDVCLSAYLQNFKWLPYAASMEDIGFYYRQYERLMAHWESVLPLPILDVSYEKLVANPESVSRTLIAYCGLDWDDRCLTFYQSERAVQTASKLQVRRPIYTSSVARWKRFAAYLKPLREALTN